MSAPQPSVRARARTLALEHPVIFASALFLVFALPTLLLPLVARDFYHLERAHEYSLVRFWEADDFRFREYFWWPFDGFYCRFFRPLWSASVVVMYRLFGLSALPHRLLWLGLHVLSIVLFERILRRTRLSPSAALVALVVFVVHPYWCSFALEPIAVGSANAMVLVILFGALLSFMRWRDDDWRPGYPLAFGFCVLGLLTKEIWVIIPPALVAYDYLIPGPAPHPPRITVLIRRHAPWCVLAAVYLLFYLLVVSRHNHLRPPYYLTWSTDGYGWRMLHQVGLYLAQPLVIGVYHPLANVEVYMAHTALFLALLAFALVIYWFVLRRSWREPWVRFALALLLLSILPVLPVIVQFQEFAPGAAAVGILIAVGSERMSAHGRQTFRTLAFVYYTGALACTLAVSTVVALEADAVTATLTRAVPSVPSGTRLYFINTPQYAWLGEASLARLYYREPSLSVYHLSFDCGEVPPNPRTFVGRAATDVLKAVAPDEVTTCRPQLRRTSERSFVLTLPGRAFFDSDLGRFVLQGRGPFRVGEVMRRNGFEVHVDRVEGALPTELSYRFDEPLWSRDQIFVLWEGARARVLHFEPDS